MQPLPNAGRQLEAERLEKGYARGPFERGGRNLVLAVRIEQALMFPRPLEDRLFI